MCADVALVRTLIPIAQDYWGNKKIKNISKTRGKENLCTIPAALQATAASVALRIRAGRSSTGLQTFHFLAAVRTIVLLPVSKVFGLGTV